MRGGGSLSWAHRLGSSCRLARPELRVGHQVGEHGGQGLAGVGRDVDDRLAGIETLKNRRSTHDSAYCDPVRRRQQEPALSLLRRPRGAAARGRRAERPPRGRGAGTAPPLSRPLEGDPRLARLTRPTAGRGGARGGCAIGSLVGQLAETDEQARQLLANGFQRWEDPPSPRPLLDAEAGQAQSPRRPRSPGDRHAGCDPGRVRPHPDPTRPASSRSPSMPRTPTCARTQPPTDEDRDPGRPCFRDRLNNLSWTHAERTRLRRTTSPAGVSRTGSSMRKSGMKMCASGPIASA